MVEWAPYNIPLERRLQTGAVLFFVFMFIVSPLLVVIFTLYGLFYTNFWWLICLYLAWMVYDRKIPCRGSRPSKFWRSISLWRHFANYFPLKLVKTVDLDPENNYIIGSHPHGVLSIGAFGSFCTEATGFSEKFPGIDRYQVTLHGQFQFPFRRELCLVCGAISSEKNSIEYVLNRSKGNAISIVLGGAEEALDAHPDNYDLKLSTRKGFIKLALKHGAHLIPMYNFGENKAYDQLDNRRGTRLREFQTTFKKYFGFSPPIFFGRERRLQLLVIFLFTVMKNLVGKPIEVKKNLKPSQEEIDKIHNLYCKQLIQLFDENKTKYGIPENSKLNIY